MKKLLIFNAYFLMSLAMYGQSQPQQVIASSGGSGSSGDVSMGWTLGETVIATFSTGSAILTQGFHQPGLTVTAISTTDGLPFKVEAYQTLPTTCC